MKKKILAIMILGLLIFPNIIQAAHKYLEIIEELTEQEKLIKQPAMIRIEVQTNQEAIEKVSIFENYFQKLKYKKQIHDCTNEEHTPCTIIPIND